MVTRISGKYYNEAVPLEDTVNKLFKEVNFRENADRYYFAISGCVVEPKKKTNLPVICERFIKNNITASVVVQSRELDDLIKLPQMTGGEFFTNCICTYAEPVTDFIKKFHKLKSQGKVYRTIMPTGWKVVALEADITSDYKTVYDRGVTEEDRLKYADQDGDTLLDLEELRYTYDDNQIIRWDDNGKVVLPSIQDCINFFADKPYMSNPFEQYGSMDFSAMNDWRILPVKSDPSSDDSDGDELDDVLESEIGTKVLSADTDGDRLDDGKEVLEMYDPLDSNPDGDSYDDLEEYRYGTSPYTYDLDYEEWHSEFLIGFFGGDFINAEYIPTMLGQVTSGFVPVVADLRDTIANIAKNQWGSAALSALGLIPAAGDAIKIAGNVGGFIAKHVDDASNIVSAVALGAKEAPDILKHLPTSALGNLEEGIPKIQKMSKTDYAGIKNAGEVIGKNFDELLSPEVNKAKELASRVGKHSDKFTKIVNKCGETVADAVKNLSSEDANKFLEVFTKQVENVDFYKVLKNSTDPGKAVKFLADYGDNAAEIFGKYGDNIVDIVKKCDAPKTAINAIKRSGDKAIKALEKVNTKECAAAIIRYNGAAGIIEKYGKDALDAIKSSEGIKTVNSTISAIEKRGDNAIKAFKICTPSKECSDLILIPQS